jgi:plastocyanin
MQLFRPVDQPNETQTNEGARLSRIRIALAGLVAVVAVVGVFAGTSLAAGSKKAAASTTVTVKASEFKFVLSTKSVAKGKVVFKVTNVGKEAHNFVILSGINKATPLIQPKKTANLTVTFKKAGKYTYECTVGEHAEEGMIGTLTVK